jgi:hypothetical protein
VADLDARGTAIPPYAPSWAQNSYETPQLVPFARGVYHIRNRTMLPGGGSPQLIGLASLMANGPPPSNQPWNIPVGLSAAGLSSSAAIHGRFMQPDPNATGMVLLSSMSFHGRAIRPYVDSLNLRYRFMDGPQLYQYLRSNPWRNSDPLGLWSEMGPDSTMYDPLTGEYEQNPLMRELERRIKAQQRSSTRRAQSQSRMGGTLAQGAGIGASLGRIIGAGMTSLAFGDRRSLLHDDAFMDITMDVASDVGIEFVGMFMQNFSNDFAVGFTFKSYASTLKNAVDPSTESRDWLALGSGLASDLALEQLNRQHKIEMTTISRTVGMAFGGIGIAAGVYSGMIEYAADRAYDW